MVILSKPAIQRFSIVRAPTTLTPTIPSVDLSRPDSETQLINSCQELGFFKLTNHNIPIQLIKKLESEALKFFSLPISEKSKSGPPDPFGYGDRKIGPNGDTGWVEYLLLTTSKNSQSHRKKVAHIFGDSAALFLGLVDEYVSTVKKMACEILEIIAVGLKIEVRNGISKLLMDEESDSIFRVNHYPPCRVDGGGSNGGDLIGFGEHTDPQIISILRSNDACGLQILTKDGNWISVPPDPNAFFVSVGDSLQVMTNGRLKSVRHRVMANSTKSRVSMIYFGGPPLSEKIVPLMKGEESLYREFTWYEYKKSAYQTRLGDDRLLMFEKNVSTECA